MSILDNTSNYCYSWFRGDQSLGHGIRLAFSSTVSLKMTNISAMIPGMYRRVLALSGAVGSGETNILAMIPDMYRLILALSAMVISREQHIGES